jgi:hypothetical protein
VGIWIRSQDKKQLIKANAFWVGLCGSWDLPNKQAEGKFKVQAVIENECEFIAGIYPTEERALQVLDEIDNAKCRIRLAELGVANIMETEREFPGFTFWMPAE